MKYRALVYDAKGDILPILASIATCKIVPINPFDDRGYAWRLRDDVTDGTLALEVANSLIHKEDGDKPFFVESARAIVAGVMQSFNLSGGKWNFLDVCIAMRTEENMHSFLKSTQRPALLSASISSLTIRSKIPSPHSQIR